MLVLDFAERKRLYEEIISRYPAYRETLTACVAGINTERIVSDSLFLYAFAPPMTSFVSWLIKEAQAEGIERLYFLARDGWMMKKCAEILSDGRMDCRYLEVSRYSMRSAQYHLLQEKSADLLCAGGIDVTFEKIMRRGSLTAEEAALTAEEIGYAGRRTEVLHAVQLAGIKEKLKADKRFLERIYAHAEEKYPHAKKFLENRGLLEDVPYAVVDSGWVGTLQQSIAQIAGRKIKGFYFGLYGIPRDADPSDYRWFYFGPAGDIERKAGFSNCLFETVFSAPEGMTLGYTEDGEPVFDPNPNPNQKELLREKELMTAFARSFQGFMKETRDPEPDRRMTEELFSVAMARPGRPELEAFGGRLFCDDILEMQLQPVAAELSEEQIKRLRVLNKVLTMAGIRKNKISESAWLEGSILRVSSNPDSDLRQASFYKKVMYKRQEWRNRGNQ